MDTLKILLIGISIGMGLNLVQTTRNHVVLPMVHKVQKVVRPIPQDKIEAQQKKEAKRKAKFEKQQEKANGR